MPSKDNVASRYFDSINGVPKLIETTFETLSSPVQQPRVLKTPITSSNLATLNQNARYIVDTEGQNYK